MLFLFTACEGDLERMNGSVVFDKDVPDASYTNFNITYSDSGIVKVKITGLELFQFASKKTPDRGLVEGRDIMIDSVHVRFLNTEGAVTSELFADSAIRFHDSGKMNAVGNVIVINEAGEQLNTPRLLWDAKQKQIICDTTVVITKPSGQQITGSSLVSDERFENYKITKVIGKLPFKREEAPE